MMSEVFLFVQHFNAQEHLFNHHNMEDSSFHDLNFCYTKDNFFINTESTFQTVIREQLISVHLINVIIATIFNSNRV